MNKLASLALLCGLTWSGPSGAMQADRLHTLARGANLVTLFNDNKLAESTLTQIKADGFGHVRIFVEVEYLSDPAYLVRLDRLVQQTAERRLGLILCMHSFKHTIDKEQSLRSVTQPWIEAWRDLAARYRTSSPNYLFLELGNEPTGDYWDALQPQLYETVRRSLPRHTVLLTNSPYSTVWVLPGVVAKAAGREAATDNNVAWVFHLYQPMVVSHQGAHWMPNFVQFKGLVYPPNEANIKSMTRPNNQQELDAYRKDGRHMIADEIAAGAKWSAQHHVPVLVTEFGVIRQAPQATRVAWLTEARQRLEAAHIGWTVWEYDGGFGVTPLFSGAPMAAALGLHH